MYKAEDLLSYTHIYRCVCVYIHTHTHTHYIIYIYIYIYTYIYREREREWLKFKHNDINNISKSNYKSYNSNLSLKEKEK